MNVETFKEAAGPNNAALNGNGHKQILKYTPYYNRQRNIGTHSSTKEEQEAVPTYILYVERKTEGNTVETALTVTSSSPSPAFTVDCL